MEPCGPGLPGHPHPKRAGHRPVTGATGDTFTAGRLGEYTVQEDDTLGSNVLLGLPFIYNADNIDNFNW